MALWDVFPNWSGNDRTVEASLRKAEEEESKREYINQLQNQWHQTAVTAMDQSLYNGLCNGLSNVTVSSSPNLTNFPGMLNHIPPNTVTHPMTVTNPGHQHGIYSRIYTSTSAYPPASWNPMPAVTPQAPQIGDKLIMEWDGKDWITRYEAANPPSVKPPPMKGIEFSLDELEEASRLIEDLQHEAA